MKYVSVILRLCKILWQQAVDTMVEWNNEINELSGYCKNKE